MNELRKAKRIVPFLVIAALLLAAVSASADEGDDHPWTGEPDPYACNEFLDCFWIITVCIEGTTYEVGLYYDPAEVTPEEIEEDALFWSGTELTVGACPRPRGNLIFDGLWAYGNTERDDEICYIISTHGEPSVERRRAVCEPGYNWPDGVDRPGWVDTAYLLAHGAVYDDGTVWGWWEGDSVAGALRLPLRAMEGYNTYLFKEFCHYTAEIGEPKGWCK